MGNDLISRASAKSKKVYCLERHEFVVPVAELDWLPAADAVHVRHGRWIKTYRSGMPVKAGLVSSCCDMWAGRQSDYCPSCGARMDKEVPKND